MESKQHRDRKGRPLRVGDHVVLHGIVKTITPHVVIELTGTKRNIEVLGEDLEIGPHPAPGGPGDPGGGG